MHKQVSVTKDMFYTSPVTRLQTGKIPSENPAGIAMMESSPLAHPHKPRTGRNSHLRRNLDQVAINMRQDSETEMA